jgi:hypothetical protein
MKTVSAFRFGLWVLFVTAGCLALPFRWTLASTLILGFSGLLLVCRSDFSRDVPQREVVFTLAFFAAGIPLLCIVWSFWSGPQVLSVVSHPAFVVPMWLLMLAVNFKRWKHDRQKPVKVVKQLNKL